LLVFSASPLTGQAVMTGIVREDSGSRALFRVVVSIEGSERRSVTDSLGRYLIASLPAGVHIALFRSLGFQPVRIRINLRKRDTLRVDARMVRDRAVQLAPVTVTGPPGWSGSLGLDAFEHRRRMGFGKFIDSAVLRRSEQVRLADVLRRHSSVEVVRRGSEFWAASSRRVGRRSERCWMQVIVDGYTLYGGPPLGQPVTLRNATPPDLNAFDVWSLHAVEIYRSYAETPAEFTGQGAGCGTLVLWSRRGRER
jgi:hypothetical protein